jgi:hypothetical protein
LEKAAVVGNDVVDNEIDLEQGASREHPPWFETQLRCAICLEDFAKGDNVRVLPCEHIFHVDEIDDWLINRKKLVNRLSLLFHMMLILLNSALFAKQM